MVFWYNHGHNNYILCAAFCWFGHTVVYIMSLVDYIKRIITVGILATARLRQLKAVDTLY